MSAFIDPSPIPRPLNAIFLCILANTETARIPHLSAAGKNPELTDYTPAGDAELVEFGRPICIKEPPMTPSGAPTPAVITRASMELTSMPFLFINAGLNVRPQVPLIDIGGSPGKDIREGCAVKDARRVYEQSAILGEHLGKIFDLVIIGESIPGGTTTAMAVMQALGINGRVSSSFPDNPVHIKKKVVEDALSASRISFGSLSDDPLRAIECVGDPMMPVAAGLVCGLKKTRTVLAGGTQMVSVLSIIKCLGLKRDVAIATTKYVACDASANFQEIVDSLGFTAYIADPGFDRSNLEGLRMYERGEVKEGVGAGGAMLAANLFGFDPETFRMKVEEVCRRVIPM